jgi:hypothetical protein
METKGLLLCSQGPATGSYPEPYEAGPQLPTLKSLGQILILFPHLSLGLPSVLLPSRFPRNILYAFLIFPGPCVTFCNLLVVYGKDLAAKPES